MIRYSFILFLLLSGKLGLAQFGSPLELSYGHQDGASSLDTCDIDLDGDLDIISCSKDDDKLVWYENLGGGKFGPQQIISNTVDGAMDLLAFDPDGDLDWDILIASQFDDRVSWFENLGGSFGPQQIITSSADLVRSIHAADLDNDGDVDVMSASYIDDKIAWYENLGAGAFGPEQIVSLSADGAGHVNSGDVDGDGLLDILSASSIDDKIAWYQNLGGGSFGPEQIITTLADGASFVMTYDIDGDLDNDVFYIEGADHDVHWRENIGAGVFSALENSVPGVFWTPADLKFADLDGDSDLDAGIALYSSDGCKIGERTGLTSFALADWIHDGTSANGSSEIELADLDNDGSVDAVYCSSNDGKVAWNRNVGGMQFTGQQVINSSTLSERSMEVADIDLDGLKDVLFTSMTDSKAGWYKNLGDGNFSEEKLFSDTLALIYSIYPEDLDLDGDVDMITASQGYDQNNRMISLFENDGTGNFEEIEVVTNTVSNIQVTAQMFCVDLDNDGLKDLVATSETDSEIYWFKNLGGLNFGTAQVVSSVATGVRSVRAEDLDDDGWIDLVSANNTIDEIAWYKNLGGGVFGSKQTISSTADGAYHVRIADMNGDSIPDVVSTSILDDKIAWYENLGDGSFGPQEIISFTSDKPFVLNLSDVNLDGLTDVVACSIDDGDVAWYQNLGSGTFSSKIIIDSYGNSAKYVFLEDLDYDGDPELLGYSQSDNRLFLYENYSTAEIQVKGTAYYDLNLNGVHDSTDVGLDFITIGSDPESDYTFTYADGLYKMTFSDTVGYYNITPDSVPHWSLVSDSSSYQVYVDSPYVCIDSLDFGFYPDSLINELQTEMVGGFPSCSQVRNYWLTVKNVGTTQPSGVIHLELDPNLTYISCVIPPDSVVGQNIYWALDSLYYFDEYIINPLVKMPDFGFVDIPVISFLNVIVDTSGTVVYTAHDSLYQEIQCAYDPNDKIADPVGLDSMGFVPMSTSELEYTIRFQNTGTDTAHNVVIQDELDPNLDWSSFEFLASSDPVNIEIDLSGLATFSFDNIMLPDSNTNEPESHGFIKFRIQLNPGLDPGTSIYNSAAIYFDLNPAVITNTKINTLIDCESAVGSLITPIELCGNESIELSFYLPPSNYTYDWDFGGFASDDSSHWIFNYDTSGIFSVTATVSDTACSSDTTFAVELLPVPEVFLDTVFICSTDSAMIFGTYENVDSTYQNILSSITSGCDSVVYQQLSIIPDIPPDLDTVYLCNGDSILLYGTYESSAGNYYDSLLSISGCDSLFFTEVIVNPTYAMSTDSLFMCDGDSLLLYGQYQKASGIYYDSLATFSFGCDSVLSTEIVVYPTFSSIIDSILFCEGDSVLVGGVYFDSSTIIYDSLLTVNGCDSLLGTSILWSDPNVIFTPVSDDTVCIGSGPLLLSASPASGVFSGAGVSGTEFDPAISGEGSFWITYSYTDSIGCSESDSIQINVVDCLGLESQSFSELSIRPNPFSSQTVISFGRHIDGEYLVQILDLTGREVYRNENISGSELTIDGSHFASGTYLLNLIEKESAQKVFTTKLMVE